MTAKDNPDPFPRFDPRGSPRIPGQLYALYDCIDYFNSIVAADTLPEKRDPAKQKLFHAATRGCLPFAQHLLNRTDWYSRHPDVKPTLMSPRDIPAAPSLQPRKPEPEVQEAYSMWDF